MGADTVCIPWEAYDRILAEARERSRDVMRDAWICVPITRSLRPARCAPPPAGAWALPELLFPGQLVASELVTRPAGEGTARISLPTATS